MRIFLTETMLRFLSFFFLKSSKIFFVENYDNRPISWVFIRQMKSINVAAPITMKILNIIQKKNVTTIFIVDLIQFISVVRLLNLDK